METRETSPGTNTGDYRFNPVTVETNDARIDQFAAYQKNWNGYDADEFSSDFLEDIRNLTHQLEFLPMIFPLADGGVQLEWYRYDGGYLELEIHSDDTEYRFFRANIKPKDEGEQESWHLTMPTGAPNINAVVRTFYAREIGLITKMWAIMTRDDFRAVGDFMCRFDPKNSGNLYDIIAATMKTTTNTEKENNNERDHVYE